MILYKKILSKFILLIILLIVMNYIYTRFFYEKDIQEHSSILNLVRELPSHTEILYVGESSNTSVRSDDLDKRHISEFIGDYYPDLILADLTKAAGHAGIYKILLNHIPDSLPIKTLIVTLNMRSFGAVWLYSKLETSLQKSIVLLKDYPPFVNRFLLSFKAYDIKTKVERKKQVLNKWEEELHFPYDFPYKNIKEWDKAMAERGIKDFQGKWDQEQTDLACHYIKTYAFQIDTLNNPRIKDFNKIIAFAKERNWNIAFNLLAENIQKASQLVGKDLLFLMEENRRLLVDYYSRRGVLLIDNFYAVNDNQFTDQNWTTEHYGERGRKTIAKNVAEKLRFFHPKEYKEQEEISSFQTHFFNHCEGKSSWLQMQTLSKKYAFSGNWSSPTGNGNDFSITLSYPLADIPDSLKESLNIQLQALPLSHQHQAKIVIEASGKSSTHFWKSFSLKPYLKTLHKWQKIAIHFPLPEELKKADKIKIYVYNPSAGEVMIDDFAIDFNPTL